MLSTRPSDDELFMRVAHQVATRSLCDRDQVGAVIVDMQLRITGTGRNGPPTGFDHRERTCVDWCRRAKSFEWTPRDDFSGPVPDLLYENNTVIASFPPTHTYQKELKTDDDWVRCGFEKKFTGSSDYSDCPSLHAEVNALLTSDRSRHERGTIYITSDPCWSCAKMIANSGLSFIVVESRPDKARERNAETTYAFLENLGINVIFHE
jgi:dCMP deaminase